MAEGNIFNDYATKIWENERYVAKDRMRWHTSGYYIEPGQLSIDVALEDAYEVLDIIPEEVGIAISTENWQKDYMDNPRMIAAMAKKIYNNLKQYGRYAFDQEPNWEAVAVDFIKKIQ